MPAPGQRDEVAAPPPEIEAFLDQLVYERGLSENTRESYGNDLRQFWAFVTSRGIADVGEVSGTDIVAFLGHEQDAGFDGSTIARRFAADLLVEVGEDDRRRRVDACGHAIHWKGAWACAC